MSIATNSAVVGYTAPICEDFVLDPESVICTSLNGEQVDPGTGEDWGDF